MLLFTSFIFIFYLIKKQISIYILLYNCESNVKIIIKRKKLRKAFLAETVTVCHQLKQTRVLKELRGDCPFTGKYLLQLMMSFSSKRVHYCFLFDIDEYITLIITFIKLLHYNNIFQKVFFFFK